MRPGQQNRRGRGRNNNRKPQNPLARSFESNGPDVKVRGTPAHIAEKYMSLARDAQSSGDPVLAENYLQHAEHYNRIIMAYREQLQSQGDMSGGGIQPQRFRPLDDTEGTDDMGDDDAAAEGTEEGLNAGGNQPQPSSMGGAEAAQPQQQPQQQHERHDRQDRNQRFDRQDRYNNNNQHYQRDRDRDRNFGGGQDFRGDRHNNNDRQFRRDRDNRFNDRNRQGGNDQRFRDRDQQGGDRNFNRDDRRFDNRDRQGGYDRDRDRNFNNDRQNDRQGFDRNNDDRGQQGERQAHDRQDRHDNRRNFDRPRYDRDGDRGPRDHGMQQPAEREQPIAREAEPAAEQTHPTPPAVVERPVERRPEPVAEAAAAPATGDGAPVAAKPAQRRRAAPAPTGERFQEHDQPTFLRRAPRRTKAEAKPESDGGDGDAPKSGD